MKRFWKAFTPLALLASVAPFGPLTGVAHAAVTTNVCNAQLGGSSTGVGVVTINFYGRVDCSAPVLMELDTTLINAVTQSTEATGNHFSGTATSGISQGSFFPAVVATKHTLQFRFRLTTIDGSTWDADPTYCAGVGTTSISCAYSGSITA